MDSEEFNVVHQPAHRERRFRRLFRNVPTTEILLCRFSCAYVSDLGLLLQGHLYVSNNWICFHSNIFGIEKIIEIPVDSVTTVSKAHTAKIIPNAVKIKTDGKYYLFGSLISRDNTYRLLLNITGRTHGHHTVSQNAPMGLAAPKVDERTRSIEIVEEDVSSLSSMSSTNTTESSCGVVSGPALLVAAAAAKGKPPILETRMYRLKPDTAAPSYQQACGGSIVEGFVQRLSINGFVAWLYSLPKVFIFLMLCVTLLTFLFLCATILTVRLMYIQNPSVFHMDFSHWSSTKEKEKQVLPRQTLEKIDATLGSALKMVNEAMTQLAQVKVHVRRLLLEDSLSHPAPDSPMDSATM